MKENTRFVVDLRTRKIYRYRKIGVVNQLKEVKSVDDNYFTITDQELTDYFVDLDSQPRLLRLSYLLENSGVELSEDQEVILINLLSGPYTVRAKHLKTGNIYNVLRLVPDCTGGLEYSFNVIYQRENDQSNRWYSRQLIEFIKKFELIIK